MLGNDVGERALLEIDRNQRAEDQHNGNRLADIIDRLKRHGACPPAVDLIRIARYIQSNLNVRC